MIVKLRRENPRYADLTVGQPYVVIGIGADYVRELLREDQKRRIEERLESLLLKGLNSGKPIAVTPKYWEKKRQQLIERHNAKNRVGGERSIRRSPEGPRGPRRRRLPGK